MTEAIDRSNVMTYRETPFCMTDTAQRIFDAADECVRNPVVKLGWIVGAPGTGKTRALQEYAAGKSKVIMVTMTPAHATMKQALGRVMREMGFEPPRSQHQTYEELESLLDRRSIALLIIDEAQQSYVGLSNALRCMSDKLGMAVVFCGNPTYLTNFGKEKHAFAQITSRLAVTLKLGKPPIPDVMSLLDLLGIRDAQAVKLLVNFSQSDGGLRTVHDLVQKAVPLAGSAEAVRVCHIHDAHLIKAGVQ